QARREDANRERAAPPADRARPRARVQRGGRARVGETEIVTDRITVACSSARAAPARRRGRRSHARAPRTRTRDRAARPRAWPSALRARTPPPGRRLRTARGSAVRSEERRVGKGMWPRTKPRYVKETAIE